MKVSVIIPAYNAEKTISRCLDSILYQNFTDFEVVVINDGSNDDTEKILCEYEQNNSRVKVINKKNEGVSAARNEGLTVASGEYILFVDSDDYIGRETLALLMDNITEEYDGVVFGYRLGGRGNWGTDTHVLTKLIDRYGVIIPSRKVLEHVLTINPDEEILGYAVRYLYKKTIIDKYEIQFDTSLRISEDYKFIVEFLNSSKKIYVIDRELYTYDVNGNSATSRYMPSLNDDMNSVNEWIKLNVYCGNQNIINEHKGCIANAYLNHVQNIAKTDSGFSLIQGIVNIYKIKREYSYSNSIKYTVKCLKSRKKAEFAFRLFALDLDFVYFILFFIRRRI